MKYLYSILLVSVLFFTPHVSQQLPLPDADKKEILSILFEQELLVAQKGELTILMSPRANAGWLLDLPGLRFKQIAYEDEKKTSEYYELHITKVKRDYVEASLRKRNYCKGVGTDYQFRKEAGKWKAKIAGFHESFTASGTDCVGCKTGSGAVYSLKNKRLQPAPPKPKDLILKGNVLAITCARSDARYIHCKVDLSLDFVNQSNHPIIILQPDGKHKFWHGGTLLALSKVESEAYNYVYNSAAWPSFYHGEEYRLLAEGLDQATPPANLTRTIAPADSLNWKTTIQFALSEENSCSGSTGVEVGWKEIKKLTSPVWLEISYEMWPFNVENFRKDLGGQLRERWKTHGILYLEEKSDRYWFAHLTSEPIELDFQNVKLD